MGWGTEAAGCKATKNTQAILWHPTRPSSESCKPSQSILWLVYKLQTPMAALAVSIRRPSYIVGGEAVTTLNRRLQSEHMQWRLRFSSSCIIDGAKAKLPMAILQDGFVRGIDMNRFINPVRVSRARKQFRFELKKDGGRKGLEQGQGIAARIR